MLTEKEWQKYSERKDTIRKFTTEHYKAIAKILAKRHDKRITEELQYENWAHKLKIKPTNIIECLHTKCSECVFIYSYLCDPFKEFETRISIPVDRDLIYQGRIINDQLGT